jgi:hypothetical protein
MANNIVSGDSDDMADNTVSGESDRLRTTQWVVMVMIQLTQEWVVTVID